jgi:pSer/pThr/pTyr-binding forkhead associated (FHA) protein
VAGAAPPAAAAPPPGPGSCQLRLTWRRRELALEPGEHVLGRTREASLWVDHMSVSRRHATVRVAGDAAHIEDCGSKNGTFVNGVRAEGPTLLRDGDSIRLGRAELSFWAFALGERTESVREEP